MDSIALFWPSQALVDLHRNFQWRDRRFPRQGRGGGCTCHQSIILVIPPQQLHEASNQMSRPVRRGCRVRSNTSYVMTTCPPHTFFWKNDRHDWKHYLPTIPFAGSKMSIMATDGGVHITAVTENTESWRSLRSVNKDPFQAFGWTSLRVLVQRICETYTLQLVSRI